MTTKIRFLTDLDGVCCDFSGDVIKLFNKDPVEVFQNWPENAYHTHEVLGITNGQMWKAINSTPNFWTDMTPLPWKDELISLLPLDQTYICTKSGSSPNAASGKKIWLQKHIKPLAMRFVITGHKYLCANNFSILIDDNEENCQLFKEYGGLDAWLFPAKWNKNRNYCGREIEYIKEKLEELKNE